jgi:hypothetical protein
MTNSLYPQVPLGRRIVALRSEIHAAKNKQRRISDAITMRQQTLARLQSQLALRGELGSARSRDE